MLLILDGSDLDEADFDGTKFDSANFVALNIDIPKSSSSMRGANMGARQNKRLYFKLLNFNF